MGHYVLDKNKNADNIKFALDMALRYFPQALGNAWTAKMADAFENFFHNTWYPTAKAKLQYLDSTYKKYTRSELDEMVKFSSNMSVSLDETSLAYFN